MFKTTGILAALAIGFASTAAHAVVLTFDDVPGGSTSNTFGEMPANNGQPDYQGFVFSRNLDWIDTIGSSWNYGAVSGEFTLLNNNAGVGSVTAADGGDFTFDGLEAKAWATAIDSGGAASVFGSLSGWNNGVEVWSLSTALNGSFQHFAAQAGAIDELRLGFGDFFLVDDLALNEETSPIPVPASLPLLAGALGLGGAFLRRRKKTS